MDDNIVGFPQHSDIDRQFLELEQQQKLIQNQRKQIMEIEQNKMTPKQLASIENEHMRLNLQPNSAINGRNYKNKVDLRAVVFDVLKTREAWTVSDLAKRMKLKEGAAHQMLKELKRDGYLTCRTLHDEFVFEHRKI